MPVDAQHDHHVVGGDENEALGVFAELAENLTNTPTKNVHIRHQSGCVGLMT